MFKQNPFISKTSKISKSYPIYTACTFIIRETPACSCLPVSSAEFLKIPFSWNIPGESDSDYIFDIFKANIYIQVSFLVTVFLQKNNAKQPSGSKIEKS